jgi:tetratricopeptide (TPR) repeat protein
MNTIRLCGGLGNQLFQYAFGKVQETNGIKVKYDLFWFKKPQVFSRPYLLDKFQVNVSTINYNRTQKKIKEKKYAPDLLKLDNHYFDGYWQYFEYYKNIIPLLKKEFCVRENLLTKEFFELKEEVTNCNSIALHVRRGDLLINDRDYAQELEYYERALDCMNTLKTDCKVFVFSDDMEWCKENFKDATFVTLVDYLSFELMKFCKHFIITNSTFSWWTSLLCENEDKTIIAPKMWRSDPVDQAEFEKRLYLFDKWMIL